MINPGQECAYLDPQGGELYHPECLNDYSGLIPVYNNQEFDSVQNCTECGLEIDELTYLEEE
ncbi:MAG: hypothetical protein ACXABG_12770 [Promethearchaeota archaeon]